MAGKLAPLAVHIQCSITKSTIRRPKVCATAMVPRHLYNNYTNNTKYSEQSNIHLNAQVEETWFGLYTNISKTI